MFKSVILFVSALVVAVPSTVAAQPQPFDGKVAITLTFGGQPGSENASRTTTFPLYGEDARIETAHEIGGGFLFDIGGSYKVWKSLGVGLSYSRVGSTSDATISGQIPHPNFTNSPRTFSAAANDLDHAENAVHLQAIWFYPVHRQNRVLRVRRPLVLQRHPGLQPRSRRRGFHRDAAVQLGHPQQRRYRQPQGERGRLQHRRGRELCVHEVPQWRLYASLQPCDRGLQPRTARR